MKNQPLRAHLEMSWTCGCWWVSLMGRSQLMRYWSSYSVCKIFKKNCMASGIAFELYSARMPRPSEDLDFMTQRSVLQRYGDVVHTAWTWAQGLGPDLCHTHTLEDSTVFMFSFCRLKVFLDQLNTFFSCNLSWLSECQETCQTLGHNSATECPERKAGTR